MVEEVEVVEAVLEELTLATLALAELELELELETELETVEAGTATDMMYAASMMAKATAMMAYPPPTPDLFGRADREATVS